MTDTDDRQISAEVLARALDAASAHPTGEPNKAQTLLAERMAAWLEHHDSRPDREE